MCVSIMARVSHKSTTGDFSASRGGLSADSRGVTDCLAINSQPIESGFIS
jgi:hypothetical protein